MYYLGIILASIAGYFIGSISWSILITKWLRGIDIRSTGSGNAGATNTVRLLGPWWGLLVAVLDGMKVVITAFLAVLLSLIPHYLFQETSYFIPALFVLIGHCWPIYYKFKGGKAVSCFIGLLFVSNIWYFFIFLLVWWISAGISRKVSLSSLIAAVAVALIIWFPWLNGLNSFVYQWNGFDAFSKVWANPWLRFSWMNYFHYATDWISNHHFADGMLEIIIVNFLGGGLLIYRHSSNIRRLKNHEEPQTFPRMSKEEKKELRELRHQEKLNYQQRHHLSDLESRNQQVKHFRKIKRLVASRTKKQISNRIQKMERSRMEQITDENNQ